MYATAQFHGVNKQGIHLPVFSSSSHSISIDFIYIKCDLYEQKHWKVLFFPDPYDDDLKVKTQRPRSADQPGVFQAQTGE